MHEAAVKMDVVFTDSAMGGFRKKGGPPKYRSAYDLDSLSGRLTVGKSNIHKTGKFQEKPEVINFIQFPKP